MGVESYSPILSIGGAVLDSDVRDLIDQSQARAFEMSEGGGAKCTRKDIRASESNGRKKFGGRLNGTHRFGVRGFNGSY